MVPREKSKVGRQISVTISDMADRDSLIIAIAKGIPQSTLLRYQLEAWHENPATASMLKRAEQDLALQIKAGKVSEEDLERLAGAGYEINI
jgi:hypothetical protein